MVIRFVLLLFLLISLILEATAIRIPLTLVVVLLIAMTQKKNGVFLLAIVCGFILDSLMFRILGETSAFFLLAVGLLFLYGRKYETDHLGFASVFLLVSSIVYELVFGLPNAFIAGIIASVIGIAFLLVTHILASNQPQKLGL